MTQVDARQILRHRHPFRFIERVTLQPNHSARAELVLPKVQPLWAELPERSFLVAEAAAQTMGVLIRMSAAAAPMNGVLAAITAFDWDGFAVPVHALEVKHTGTRAAFHDFSATFFTAKGIVCGAMRGTVHLSAATSPDTAPRVVALTQPDAAQVALFDVVATRDQGTSIEVDLYIRPDCPVFQGHFPGAPITPGVLIAEMMTHAAQTLLPGPAGVRSLRDLVFAAPLLPGETVTLRLKQADGLEFSATLLRAGKRLARAHFALARLPASFSHSTQPKGTTPMETIGFSSEIAERIRNIVIYEGLELEELGISLDDVGDDVLLFDGEGLDLDSVDALEVLAGVQREFGVQFPEIDGDFIANNCSTVGQLARTVTVHLAARDAA